MRRMPRLILLLAAVPLAWLSSCATAGKSGPVKLDAESTAHFEAGRYQEAVDVYREVRQDHPGDKAVAANYSKTLDRILGAGDAAMKKGDFASAEKIYAILQKAVPGDEPVIPPPSFTRAGLETRIRSARISLAAGKADRCVRAGDFQKAVDGYRELLKAYPGEPAARSKVAGGLEAIRECGDAAMAKEYYSKAGMAYYPLWKSYPLFRKAGQKLSFNKESLDDHLAACRTALTRQGLELYRKGDLKAAISVWKSLLLFDPDNAQISKSIESATAQLNRIQSSDL